MDFSDKMIDRLSEMSKLSFEGEERVEIKEYLKDMTEFMSGLKDVDTTGVEPLIHMSSEVNVLREDNPETTITHEQALRNAPKKDSDYIRIPKVLDKSLE